MLNVEINVRSVLFWWYNVKPTKPFRKHAQSVIS